MGIPHSDALVFFGATGDLAYKKIFPALQAMVKHGHLDVPVIGVAKAGWNIDQLRARARDSVAKHEYFHCLRSLQRTAQPTIMLRSERFQDDMVILLVNDGPCSLVNFKILPQPPRDHDLTLRCEGYCVGLC